MKLILTLAFRNLIRQKRRNILLGIAISFGMMILVIANSFSHGISDTLMNRIIVLMTGHMDVAMIEEGNARAPFMREKNRFEKLILENVTGIKYISENLGLLARVVGNGKSDNCWLEGIGEAHIREFSDQMNTVEGDVADIFSKDLVNPCVLSKSKAEFLNIKLHDPIRVRLQNIYGQQQTGILTVCAIVKSSNMFTGFAAFLSSENIKLLRGLRPYETGSLQVILENPDTAVEQANNLHRVLKPGHAVIYGKIITPEEKRKKKEIDCFVMGYFRDAETRAGILKRLDLPESQVTASFSEKGVMISKALSQSLLLNIGDRFTFRYPNRYDDDFTQRDYKITGIFTPGETAFPHDGILLSDRLFYRTYYNHLPKTNKKKQEEIINRIPVSLLPSLSTEWKLLQRSRDFNEMKKKFKDFMSEKQAVAALDIRTMNETASNIVKLEYVLNLITFLAVLILFFIILIGVVNTLRMTIKERTREIGTMRAIGMRQRDVRNLIVAETFLLSLFSTIFGTMMAFMAMALLKTWEINADSFMNILLVDHRLYFLPRLLSILLNMVLILLISLVTAFFPAQKASGKLVAEALRYFE